MLNLMHLDKYKHEINNNDNSIKHDAANTAVVKTTAHALTNMYSISKHYNNKSRRQLHLRSRFGRMSTSTYSSLMPFTYFSSSSVLCLSLWLLVFLLSDNGLNGLKIVAALKVSSFLVRRCLMSFKEKHMNFIICAEGVKKGKKEARCKDLYNLRFRDGIEPLDATIL
uniref:Uncharacterized protein n=1 Tax=Glossina brevipalpis TaxID=37001 RepID=A0A1A9VZK2_9MUSC